MRWPWLTSRDRIRNFLPLVGISFGGALLGWFFPISLASLIAVTISFLLQAAIIPVRRPDTGRDYLMVTGSATFIAIAISLAVGRREGFSVDFLSVVMSPYFLVAVSLWTLTSWTSDYLDYRYSSEPTVTLSASLILLLGIVGKIVLHFVAPGLVLPSPTLMSLGGLALPLLLNPLLLMVVCFPIRVLLIPVDMVGQRLHEKRVEKEIIDLRAFEAKRAAENELLRQRQARCQHDWQYSSFVSSCDDESASFRTCRKCGLTIQY